MSLPNNNPNPPEISQSEEFTPEQLKRLASELHDFRKTLLYRHYVGHFQTLYSGTVDQILEERLKGPETLYTREGWIGEARAAKLNLSWFDLLHLELDEKVRALD